MENTFIDLSSEGVDKDYRKRILDQFPRAKYVRVSLIDFSTSIYSGDCDCCFLGKLCLNI